MTEEKTVLLKDLFEAALCKYGRTKRPSIKGKGTRLPGKQGETGFRHVYKVNCPSCRQKFMYQYAVTRNGKKKSFSSINLLELKKKVEKGGYDWVMDNKYYAEKVSKESGIKLKELL